jgi:hypothetical protein
MIYDTLLLIVGMLFPFTVYILLLIVNFTEFKLKDYIKEPKDE